MSSLGDYTVVLPPAYGDVQPIDHLATGLTRILEQFKDKNNVKALCFAALPQSQDLETTIFALLDQRGLDTAVGTQLDDLGDLLDLGRAGFSDDDYRKLLKAQMLIYRSNGTVEDIYKPFALLEPSGTFYQTDAFPAGFVFHWELPALPDPADSTRYALMLKRSRGAGIGAWFYWYPAPAAEIFSFATAMNVVDTGSSTGFSNDTLTSGGKLAGVIQA